MADAAWAELQAGESGARDKAWDRILKKNAVAKKAKKNSFAKKCQKKKIGKKCQATCGLCR